MTKYKKITVEKSHEIIMSHTGTQSSFMGINNHKKYLRMENTFRFTSNSISMNFLSSLNSDDRVSDVFFNPAMPPPGTGIDGASLRFKIYVQYNQAEVDE